MGYVMYDITVIQMQPNVELVPFVKAASLKVFFHHGNLVLGRVCNVLQPCLLVFPLESDVNMI